MNQLNNDMKIHYQKRPNEYRTCHGAHCNNRQSFEKCLVCDSTKDHLCGTDPSAELTQICNEYVNQCFTQISNEKIVRGCLKDHDTNFQNECTRNFKKCDLCSTTNKIGCNNIPYPMNKCIDCNSKMDKRCKSNSDTLLGKICDYIGNKDNLGCYLSIVSRNKKELFPIFVIFIIFLITILFFFFLIPQYGDNIRRGCIADLTPFEQRDCLQDSDHCKTCKRKNCNTKEKFQECYSCNGRDDENCAKGGRLVKTETCQAYGSSCAIGIDKKGYTHRRCNNEIFDAINEFTGMNFICDRDKCNDKIFPEDRLMCFQCNGGNECDMMSSVSLKAEPCEIHSIHDKCFTFIDKGKQNIHSNLVLI